MSKPEIFEKPLPKATIKRLADESFGDMVKFVVDLERRVIGAGGGLHADAEQLLLEHGSSQQDLWGANYYLDLSGEERFIYRSMINIRPGDGNTRQEISSPEIRQRVRELAVHYFESSR